MVLVCGSPWHRQESSLCGWLMEGGAPICFLPGELETVSQAPYSLYSKPALDIERASSDSPDFSLNPYTTPEPSPLLHKKNP